MWILLGQNQTKAYSPSSQQQLTMFEKRNLIFFLLLLLLWSLNMIKYNVKKKGIRKNSQRTLLSVMGGRTTCFSRVLITIFHSSFRSRFSTVFSQISAYIDREPGKTHEDKNDWVNVVGRERRKNITHCYYNIYECIVEVDTTRERPFATAVDADAKSLFR